MDYGIRLRRLRVVTLLRILFFSATHTFAQNDGVYFPETGHWVYGEVLAFYQRVPNPEIIYGYPITEAFEDQTTGLLIQYFQLARMELHLDHPAGQRVVLTPLGRYSYEEGMKIELQSNAAPCQVFFEDGIRVCYAFLSFYLANGGPAQFGNPVSEFEIHNDRIVQYFERARLEWHPDYPVGQQVTLAELGLFYFYDHGEDPRRLLPVPGGGISSVLDMQVRAFTAEAILSEGGSQTLFVIVQDQKLQPIFGAQLLMTLRWPSGHEESIQLPSTDEYGITEYTIPLKADEFGLVEIGVTASFTNLTDSTRASFRIWS